MPSDPIYALVSDDGRTVQVLGDQQRSRLMELAGKPVEIRERKSKRSSQANRFYWGVVIRMLADHCGYEPDEMHEALAMRFLRIEDCPVTGAPRRQRTPKTNTAEFSAYVEQCIRLAAELGVVIPDAEAA